MKNFPYPKGSLWRKWDLQIQTILDDDYLPLTGYYKELQLSNPTEWATYIAKVEGEANALKFDSKEYFNDSSIEKKERCFNYVRNCFAFLEVFNPGLECIGITDHNYFDDYLLDTFIEYAGETKCKVIPGVEISCQGIHMLLFFPNKLYEKDTYSQGIHFFLGKFNINNRTNSSGVLTTTSVDIKDIITEAKRNGGIVIYPHCNSDKGLFQGRSRSDRTHLADIFNHQKMNLLQSQNHDACIAVNNYISTNEALTAGSCSHISSDARSLKDYGRADNEGNYLWIKADPTFEGLKQILYESEQRIYIGKYRPNEKKPYFIIDKVRYIDNTEDVKFGSDSIEINENLTSIIGGKSTGKSLLLYYIAKTIDSKEVKERTISSGVPVAYDFDASPDFNFEVTWKDGQSTLLKVPTGTQEQPKDRKILYIPQKYLNTLSEANIKSREALNDFVLNVILQDSTIKQTYKEINQNISTITKSIPLEIGEIFSELEDIQKTEEDLKKIGDKKGIQTYLEKLQKESDEIKGKSGLSEEELKKYEALIIEEKNINTLISNLEADKKTINRLAQNLDTQTNSLKNAKIDFRTYLNNDEIKNSYDEELKIVDAFTKDINAAIVKLTNGIDLKIDFQRQELIKLNAELSPLLAKVNLQSELKEKTEAIKVEQSKLNEISINQSSLKTKKDSFKARSEAIVNSYGNIYSKYDELRNEFKKFENKFGDITLGVHINFKDIDFNLNVINEYVNKHSLKRTLPEVEWGDEYFYKYEPTTHLATMKAIFEGLLNNTINTVKSRQSKDAASKILDDYFYLDFRIFYKNDSLDKMSPGKKGLVLLQLLINLSDEEWPILLDQPEDDLDNRSVYEDLVGFLKKKKLQRQIIIVTHNPNLVVGADAEETIVANQSGQEVGRDNKKFRFEYVSGALENTFELEEAEEPAILNRKGIRQHVYEILEGGKEAFQKREQKYDFNIE